VDANGGVYVLGDSSQPSSNFAYIPYLSGGWSQLAVAITGMSGGLLRDVDASGDTGAMVALQQNATGAHSLVAWALPGSDSTPVDTADRGSQPKGIAKGTNGMSYVANFATDGVEGVWPPGSISIINNSSLGIPIVVPAVPTLDFQPNDISFFTRDGVNYLGLVGRTTAGTNQAWRVTLNDGGMPMMDSSIRRMTLSTTMYSNDQYCAVSADGTLFWVTDPQFNTVTVIDTDNNWQGHQVSVFGQPEYIATYVPEPSSLIALLTGAVGLIGLRRRRRQKF
jgi:hypothetical protein